MAEPMAVGEPEPPTWANYTYAHLEATYGTLPDFVILFPIEEDRQWQRFSIKSVYPEALAPGHFFAHQLAEYRKYMLNPPLGGNSTMAGVDVETAEMRIRTACQVSSAASQACVKKCAMLRGCACLSAGGGLCNQVPQLGP